MNPIDRLVGFVSPRAAVRRLRARSAMAAMTQARMIYEGATSGRRAQGWRVVSTDANAEVRAAGARLRDVARDMVRNNPHGARAKSVIATNVVGKGIIPSIVTDVERARKPLQDLMKALFDSTAIDVEGRHNLYGLQDLAVKTMVESGEVIIRRRQRRPEDGLPVPLQLQVMEPDHLDAMVDGELSNGNFAAQGVEYDKLGRIVAYHLFPDHPGQSSTWSLPKSQRIPREFVAHVFRSDRPGQARGVTWFAPVILPMRDLRDLSDAKLMQQKVAACFAAFIKTDEEFDGTAESGANYPVETLEPAMIERLKPGEEVSFGTPPQIGDYEAFSRATLREIAVGLGISYEALTGDYSKVNFSSARMGWLEFQRSIDEWRDLILVPQFCDRVGAWFLEAAATQLGRRFPASITWTAPRREMVAPEREVPAVIAAIRAGLTSLPEEQRKLGFDSEDLLKEIAETLKTLDREGLVLDTDPRRVTQAGNPMAATFDDEDDED